jgi:hypothetical protein
MLGDKFLLAESVRTHTDQKVEIVINPADGEEEAFLASLRPSGYGGRSSLPFAANNDAYLVRANQVHSETVAGKQVWTLSLLPESHSAGPLTEMTVNGVEPDEIARRRAGRILLDDPPFSGDSHRNLTSDSLVEASVQGLSSASPVRECVIRSVFREYGHRSEWKDFARLKSVFALKITDTVEHVLELSLKSVRNKQIEVVFRGRRPKRYSNVPAEMIEINGFCSLS